MKALASITVFAFLLLFWGLVPAQAQDSDQPQEWVITSDHVGPVRFGMTLEEAEREVGSLSIHEIAGGCKLAQPFYMPEGLELRACRGAINGVIVQTPVVRTPEDIGVGSTESEVREAYGSRVESSSNLDNDHLGLTILGYRPADAEAPGIGFHLYDGRVIKMLVSDR